MTTSIIQKGTTNRTYRLRGTLVRLDLVQHIIDIQPSEHDGKRVRRLAVMPDSKILAGDEHKTLADLIVGEWVTAQFINQGGQAILKRLYIPRGTVSSPPSQPQEGSPCTGTMNEPMRKTS